MNDPNLGQFTQTLRYVSPKIMPQAIILGGHIANYWFTHDLFKMLDSDRIPPCRVH